MIEPHIHMYSRTTDDYQAMFKAGIRAVVEPSFWLGSQRRYAGTFFDYFQLILEFETQRANRFGIDHFAAVSFNPKEAENRALVDEVLEGMGEYLDHPRCVALGEIGFNNLTDNEEYAFEQQLQMAKERDMPVIVHISHTEKVACLKRILKVFEKVQPRQELIYLDHNTEDTIEMALAETNCWCGLTVYPISKLDEARASSIIHQVGADRLLVSGSADWGISDPLSLPKVMDFMKQDGHSDETLEKLSQLNAEKFYGQTAKWKPDFTLEPWPIKLRQP